MLQNRLLFTPDWEVVSHELERAEGKDLLQICIENGLASEKEMRAEWLQTTAVKEEGQTSTETNFWDYITSCRAYFLELAKLRSEGKSQEEAKQIIQYKRRQDMLVLRNAYRTRFGQLAHNKNPAQG